MNNELCPGYNIITIVTYRCYRTHRSANENPQISSGILLYYRNNGEMHGRENKLWNTYKNDTRRKFLFGRWEFNIFTNKFRNHSRWHSYVHINRSGLRSEWERHRRNRTNKRARKIALFSKHQKLMYVNKVSFFFFFFYKKRFRFAHIMTTIDSNRIRNIWVKYSFGKKKELELNWIKIRPL